MRYAECHRMGHARVAAYIHVEDDGTIRLARPLAKNAALTVYVETAPETSAPDHHDRGEGPDGTYHA